MTQSLPLRSASLRQRYLSSAPTTWSITQQQSRSEHVPGNTTTPNFIRPTSLEGNAGSPRNRRFRGVRIRPPRTSTPVTVHLDLEVVVLDDVIGKELFAPRLDTLPRFVLAARLQADLDVFADSHVRDFAETEGREALLDGDALRIVDDRLRCNDYASDHGRRPRREIRGTDGPDARRGRAPERAHPSMRKRGAEAATTQMGRMGPEDPARDSGRDREINARSLAWVETRACPPGADMRLSTAPQSA